MGANKIAMEADLPTHHKIHAKQQLSWSGLIDRALRAVFGLVLCGCLCSIYYSVVAEVALSKNEYGHGIDVAIAPKHKVALEAHIMSKCPDARDCLRDLIVPAMQNVSDIVDFSLSYIGTLNSKDADEPVTCMHGPAECFGNEIELCAADLYPNVETYLGFTLCLSESYAHIPERSLFEQCALEHGIDFAKLNECVSRDDGNYAMDLLRKSVARSHSIGVTTSCTVRLNDEVRCIRDAGKWKDCPGGSTVEDLIRDIEAASASASLRSAESDDL